MQYLKMVNVRNRQDSTTLASTPSVCSAHPDVLLASLLLARQHGQVLLIEATSNQVNQFGGYTGMQPADFITYVHGICAKHGIARELVLFGGDHLGPQVWRDQSTEHAMKHASDLVASYVKAGFNKIHLDCSEGCAGEPAQVGDDVSAERAAILASVCEQVSHAPQNLSYIVGTEVPAPGGARAEEGQMAVIPTSAANASRTIRCHRQAFEQHGLNAAWERVAALVVQPGLEFAPDSVHHFDLQSPDMLSGVLDDYAHLAFEAHSTDYQRPAVFAELARRHFTVLKVGPALTFSYRQAIYALDQMAGWLAPVETRTSVAAVMEVLMHDAPEHWRKHYSGNAQTLHLLRHFSYADRIRYYWGHPAARRAVQLLLQVLTPQPQPMPALLAQFFSLAVIERADKIRSLGLHWAQALVLAEIQLALQPYFLDPGTVR